MHFMRRRQAFTLIELLVVIAIIAILAVVVVLTLNPAQLLAQSRDATRVSDMATLNSALALYQTDFGGTGSMGTSTVVYVSLSDNSSSTCGSLGLPALPTGYSYDCSPSTSTRLTNTQGWIPINFQNISSGAPFGSLPIDPVNSSSSRLYYTYDTNGSQYETTASMESSKYKMGGSNDVISSDGGLFASVYEKGTGIGLEPLDYGDNSLVGYWPLNEGSGSIAYYMSGSNATGTWTGTKTGTNGTYYSPGKVGSWAGTFDGSTDYVKYGTGGGKLDFIGNNNFTISLWIYLTSTSSNKNILHKWDWGNWSGYQLFFTGSNNIEFMLGNGVSTWGVVSNLNAGSSLLNVWTHVVIVSNGTTVQLYTNGVSRGSTPISGSIVYATSSPLYVGYLDGNIGTGLFPGLIDDLRIYNRALSAAEIQAMYNAGK